ncbi:MAG: FixH family protein [Hyphomicrobiaceae bacterium]
MTVDPRAAGARKPGELGGRHVLLMLLAFFGVVFAVNGVFLASALSTYSGVISAEPYVKGLKYNERIEAGERQDRLGWHETLAVERDGAVALVIADGAGAPVTGLSLTGSIGRPSTSKLDRPLTLAEAEPGRYVARGEPLDDGTWVLTLAAAGRTDGTDPVYRLRRRVWLKR